MRYDYLASQLQTCVHNCGWVGVIRNVASTYTHHIRTCTASPHPPPDPGPRGVVLGPTSEAHQFGSGTLTAQDGQTEGTSTGRVTKAALALGGSV